MAITIRQRINKSASSGTPNATFNVAPVTGNLWIAFVAVPNPAIGSFTVNTGNWTQFSSCDNGTDVLILGLYRYVQGGDTAAIPQVFSAGNLSWNIFVFELQGVSGTWANDFQSVQKQYITPSGSSFTTASQTTVGANALAFLVVNPANISATGNSLGGNWTGFDGVAIAQSLYGGGSADTVTLNAGASAFNMSVPSGFSAWDASGATTWDPTQCSSDITLSNGNLTASRPNASAWRAVRSNTTKTTGKYYFEIFVNASSAAFDQVYGIANAQLNLSNYVGSDVNSAGYQSGGGTTLELSPGGWQNIGGAQGIYVAIAIDVGAGLIWARTSSSTNWNNNGSANPSTGVGGYTFGNLVFGAWDWNFNFNFECSIVGDQSVPTSGTDVSSTVTLSASTTPIGYMQAIFGIAIVNVNLTGVSASGAVAGVTPNPEGTPSGAASAGAAAALLPEVFVTLAARSTSGTAAGVTPGQGAAPSGVGTTGAVAGLLPEVFVHLAPATTNGAAVGVTPLISGPTLGGVSASGAAAALLPSIAVRLAPAIAEPAAAPFNFGQQIPFPIFTLMRDTPVAVIGPMSDTPIALVGRMPPSGQQPIGRQVFLTGVATTAFAGTVTPSFDVKVPLTAVSTRAAAAPVVAA